LRKQSFRLLSKFLRAQDWDSEVSATDLLGNQRDRVDDSLRV